MGRPPLQIVINGKCSVNVTGKSKMYEHITEVFLPLLKLNDSLILNVFTSVITII